MGTITKALQLLDLFSRATPEIGLSDFVRRTGRDKATVHRHLVELAENGFLEQDSVSRAYRLGPAILRLTAVREATVPTRSVVRPIIDALAHDSEELVHFSLLQGERLFPVYHNDPACHGTQVYFDEGEDLPFHATASGFAVLAFGPPALRASILSGPLPRHTEQTVTDPDQLSVHIEEVTRTGIGSSERGFDKEVSSRAVPIFGPDGLAMGALAIAVPASRMDPARDQNIRRILKIGMERVTRALGGTVPTTHPTAQP